jgi:hypothetical protein
MRTGRLGNPQVRMIPKMCLKNIQITSDCRSWVNKNTRGQKGADKANDPILCFFFRGMCDSRIR